VLKMQFPSRCSSKAGGRKLPDGSDEKSRLVSAARRNRQRSYAGCGGNEEICAGIGQRDRLAGRAVTGCFYGNGGGMRQEFALNEAQKVALRLPIYLSRSVIG